MRECDYKATTAMEMFRHIREQHLATIKHLKITIGSGQNTDQVSPSRPRPTRRPGPRSLTRPCPSAKQQQEQEEELDPLQKWVQQQVQEDNVAQQVQVEEDRVKQEPVQREHVVQGEQVVQEEQVVLGREETRLTLKRSFDTAFTETKDTVAARSSEDLLRTGMFED